MKSITLCVALMATAAGSLCLRAQDTYTIQSFAGAPRDIGDGTPAVQALLWGPRGVSVDRAGNLYIADTENGLVRKVGADGTISTVAGNLYDVPGGDNSQATQVLLSFPYRVLTTSAGDLYIVDTAHNRIRRVARDGVLTTVAGTGAAGYSGDGGPANQAQLNSPRGVVLDSKGNLYVLDTNNNRVRRISPGGIIQTYAGNGFAGALGDGGPAASGQLNYPLGIAIDASDNLYIADTSNHRIRVITPDGTINTLAGNGRPGYGGDNGQAGFGILNQPSDLAVDATGNLYIADSGNHRIRKIARGGGNITTVAGSGVAGFAGDNGAATQARLNAPRGVGVDAAGNLYVADTANNRIRRVTAAGTISTVAGSDSARGDNGPALSARLFEPSGIAFDSSGNLYVSDTNNHRIRKVTSAGVINTVAGTGVAGYGGDGGQATAAQLNQPNGLAVDAVGNLYVADTQNHVIRRITPAGIITTVAGTGVGGNEGDQGAATEATLRTPNGVAFDRAGNLYIADSGNNRIRRVGTDGKIRNFAGDAAGGGYQFNGDNVPAQSATLNFPFDVVVDNQDNVYVADFLNHRVRRIDPVTGLITTVAGTGAPGFSGDGGAGNQARLYLPIGLGVDSNRNLYIADSGNNRIRVVSNGVIRTIAGAGPAADAGDNGPALAAYLSSPRDVAVDANGQIYFTDQDNNRVRYLKAETSSIRSIVNAASGVGGPVAPGELVTIYGTQIGPVDSTSGTVTGGVLGSTAGNVRVLFDGVAAPILFARAIQVNAIVPYSVRGTTNVQVEVGGKLSSAFVLPVSDAAPGIFTLDGSGSGPAVAVNQDGTLNGPSNPAARGSVVVIYATGAGQTNPPGLNGSIVGSVLPQPVLTVTAGVGGKTADVLYAGGSPGSASGILQVNLRIPDTTDAGMAVPLTLAVGAFPAQSGVTIAVK